MYKRKVEINGWKNQYDGKIQISYQVNRFHDISTKNTLSVTSKCDKCEIQMIEIFFESFSL